MCWCEVCEATTLEPWERPRFRAMHEVGRGILLARARRRTAAFQARQCSSGSARGASCLLYTSDAADDTPC
eukprot:4490913-Pyramimonas_sp.AAC.1